MHNRIVHRAVNRARALVTAGLVSFTCLFATDAASAVLDGYTAGTGGNTSRLVVDFSFTGGDAYVFEYRYDGEKTGTDMLRALDDAGALDVAITDFAFGAFVDGFAFAGNDHTPGFEGAAGENWSYWVDGGEQTVFDFVSNTSMREAVAFGQYVSASSGPSDRFLADGSLDGWVANVSAFNSGGFPPTDSVPSVPEPAVFVMLFALSALGNRRHRA